MEREVEREMERKVEREMEAVGADMVEGGEVADGGRELVEQESDLASCPGGWSQFGQRCFRLMTSARTWGESEVSLNWGETLV